MKFDTIIIGGGLSGMTCAIQLAKARQRVAVISAGQSTLHFHSGSFELLGYLEDGSEVADLSDGLKHLDKQHPYSRMGADNTLALAQEAKQLLAEAGIATQGDGLRNHYRLTPVGGLKPAWLTVDGFMTADSSKAFPYKNITLIDIEGFLDLPVAFLKDGLEKAGVRCMVKTIHMDEFSERRRSQTEMRASNLAKILSKDGIVQQLAREISRVAEGEAVLLPSILSPCEKALCEVFHNTAKPVCHFMATLPPSVPGIAIQEQLRKQFCTLGGRFLMGDEAIRADVTDGKVKSIYTAKLADTRLEADNYVLATGSFMSRGLRSNYEGVYEPLFGVDVCSADDRSKWSQDYVFDAQPYMQFGVHTDMMFRATKDGQTISNLYVAGSVLGSHNAVKMADGTGVSMLTALFVAKKITEKLEK